MHECLVHIHVHPDQAGSTLPTPTTLVHTPGGGVFNVGVEAVQRRCLQHTPITQEAVLGVRQATVQDNGRGCILLLRCPPQEVPSKHRLADAW